MVTRCSGERKEFVAQPGWGLCCQGRGEREGCGWPVVRHGRKSSVKLHSVECTLEVSVRGLSERTEGLCFPWGVEGDPHALINIARAPLRLSTFKNTKHSHQSSGDTLRWPPPVVPPRPASEHTEESRQAEEAPDSSTTYTPAQAKFKYTDLAFER